jgi:hypothetical protein
MSVEVSKTDDIDWFVCTQETHLSPFWWLHAVTGFSYLP